MQPFSPSIRTNTHPLVVAHRGISSRAPENTMASFALAVRTPGIDMIELDVRLSKDGEVIVLHDRTLQRTTTGNGPARALPYASLRSYDAGSWFHPSFAAERIPTLRQVLDLVRGHRWLDIELKSDTWHPWPKGMLERRVLESVDDAGMTDQVMYSSFDHALLRSLKQLRPQAHVAALRNVFVDLWKPPSAIARDAHADIIVMGQGQLTERAVLEAHGAGIAVFVYTVNSREEAMRAVEWGVDAIISDAADEITDLVRPAGLPRG